MLPYLNVFGIMIPMYGVCALAGIIAACLLLHFTTKKRRDYSKVQIINIPLFATIGGFIGAHLVYALTRIDIIAALINHFSELTETVWIFFGVMGDLFGGMVFYGGLLGALAGGAVYCRFAKIDFWLYADIFAPAIPLFHAFGRVGCYLSGCCYGIVSELGLYYHSDSIVNDLNDVKRIPIQLIEAGCNLLIMLVLLLLSRKKLKEGSLLAAYFVLYPIVRFTDEFFRGDAIRGNLLGLSTSQWISVVVLVLGIIMLLRRYVFRTREQYGTRLDYGQVPEGYIYNRYAGAVPPSEQHLLQQTSSDTAAGEPTE